MVQHYNASERSRSLDETRTTRAFNAEGRLHMTTESAEPVESGVFDGTRL
jgi:hypothetical protein